MAESKRLFYISDQLVQYLREANYGNGLAHMCVHPGDLQKTVLCQKLNGHDPDIWQRLADTGIDQESLLSHLQRAENQAVQNDMRARQTLTMEDLRAVDVTRSLDLVLNRRIANVRVLQWLFRLIICVGDLQSRSDGRRVHYDSTMFKHFGGTTNTRWYLPRPGTELVDLTPVMSTGHELSAFQRLQQQGSLKLGSEEIPFFINYDPKVHTADKDNWGFCQQVVFERTTLPEFITYFRIRDVCLLDIERQALQSEDVDGVETNQNIIDASHLSDDLSELVLAHCLRKDGAKQKIAPSGRGISVASLSMPIPRDAVTPRDPTPAILPRPSIRKLRPVRLPNLPHLPVPPAVARLAKSPIITSTVQTPSAQISPAQTLPVTVPPVQASIQPMSAEVTTLTLPVPSE